MTSKQIKSDTVINQWFENMSSSAQRRYIKEHPKSRLGKSRPNPKVKKANISAEQNPIDTSHSDPLYPHVPVTEPAPLEPAERNPGLHLLYVKTAVGHLRLIDEMLYKLPSNLNLLDLAQAICTEREKLIKNVPGYSDAQEILDELKLDARSIIQQDC